MLRFFCSWTDNGTHARRASGVEDVDDDPFFVHEPPPQRPSRLVGEAPPREAANAKNKKRPRAAPTPKSIQMDNAEFIMSLNGAPMEDEDFSDPDGNGGFEEDPFAALERVEIIYICRHVLSCTLFVILPPLPTPAKKEKQTRTAGAQGDGSGMGEER
jgi:hypothetical protein